VHSPTLSGTTQAEAYRPLRLPTILVASPHLGGISTTLASYESLLIRGYTVDALVCLEEEYYENHRYFEKWSRERGMSFATMQRPPEVLHSPGEDAEQMHSYYSRAVDGIGHYKSNVTSLIIDLQHIHEQRLKELEEAPAQARSIYWYPFVQHSHLQRDEDIMVIDSAHKDDFIIHRPTEVQNLQPIFDGSASWWTQAFGHSNSDLMLAAAQAAGRYGHVIFPSATHAPALNLSKSLLETVGKGWADRVFFSDDGSTGMEVALKMALKKTARQLVAENHQGPVELGVLGMRGSYHGDTIGVMDASEPSVYNKSVEWYKGRGFWLDVPTVQIENEKVTLRVPTDSWETSPPDFPCSNLPSVYDVEARLQDGDKLYDYYFGYSYLPRQKESWSHFWGSGHRATGYWRGRNAFRGSAISESTGGLCPTSLLTAITSRL
jgi:dethiobiotin synthetase/adenosylmethionine--8-amino-7-oxononanoate aminotransferase